MSARGAEERAALVGLVTGSAGRAAAERSLDELAGLASTAGARVVLRVLQERPRPDAATFLGSGKIASLAEACDEAGADLVIDYRREDVAARVLEATAGEGSDRVIEVDFAANVGASLAAVRAEGDIVVYGSGLPEIPVPFFPAILKNARLQFFIVYNLADADRKSGLAGVTALLTQDRLTHNLDARLPLARIAEAHELVESGKAIGNVVIDTA